MFGPEIYFLYVDLHDGISIAKYQPLIRAEEFFTWLICILFAAERILFAVTVYKDAKSGAKNMSYFGQYWLECWGRFAGLYIGLCEKQYTRKK